MNQLCPCGEGDYAQCCGRYHAGEIAPTAEALMRSRYSAYVLKLENYLRATWHSSTCPASLELAVDSAKWLGLQVKSQRVQSENHGTVEFIARYKIAGRAHRLHEISRFEKVDGRWFYVDGEFP